MLGKSVLISVMLFSSFAWSWTLAPYEGKTFASPGPNCFSSALRVTQKTPSFRGMDEKEFSAFLDLNCQKISQPILGDIGVFSNKGYAYTHAFIYLNEGWGFQKPGVDYLGKTPVATTSLNAIMYTYTASPECRRYAGKDISSCASDFAYYRCQKHRPIRHINSYIHEENIFKIEKELERILVQPAITPEDMPILIEIKKSLEKEKTRVALIPATPKEVRYLYARILSIEKQLAFMKAN